MDALNDFYKTLLNNILFKKIPKAESVPSISTIMAEGLQSDIRDDQDCQQGQKACMVLPNVTVLISFY